MAQLSYEEIQYIKGIASKFDIYDGKITHVIVVDSGRINSTYKIVVSHDTDTVSYMLQRINTVVFKNVDDVMHNALLVTNHLREKGCDTLEYVLTKESHASLLHYDNFVFRMTKFIHAEVFQSVTSPDDIQMLGQAVGDFAFNLSDMNASLLKDTIPNFHNTQSRFLNCILSAFQYSRKADKGNRINYSKEELDFVIENKDIMPILVDALSRGEIPVRVTHNDTKLNNVLFDRKLNKPRCMIDLDTVMKGSILYDLADAIRYGANTASEEETDLRKVSIDLNLVEAFIKGFNDSAPNLLTWREKALLPIAIKLMPLELGIRFLTDYYDGDVYFSTTREHHNLDRAKVQFALTKDIDRKMNDIMQIVKENL